MSMRLHHFFGYIRSTRTLVVENPLHATRGGVGESRQYKYSYFRCMLFAFCSNENYGIGIGVHERITVRVYACMRVRVYVRTCLSA